jgi:hypothetical protein
MDESIRTVGIPDNASEVEQQSIPSAHAGQPPAVKPVDAPLIGEGIAPKQVGDPGLGQPLAAQQVGDPGLGQPLAVQQVGDPGLGQPLAVQQVGDPGLGQPLAAQQLQGILTISTPTQQNLPDIPSEPGPVPGLPPQMKV